MGLVVEENAVRTAILSLAPINHHITANFLSFQWDTIFGIILKIKIT